MIDAQQALACGFVDETTALEQVATRAAVWLRDLLALPSRAMLATRQLARADLAAVWADPDALPLDAFLDSFFHPETQAVLQQLVARLKKKS
jgi:enoyl-CoA hydratase/carnithine racemase